MIIKLIFAILVIIALSYLYGRFRRQSAERRKKISFKALVYLVSGVLLLLVATGRVHWITAIFAALAPFITRLIPLALRLLPFLRHWQKQGAQRPILQTAYLRLQLDHGNGVLRGQILSGPHAGKMLEELGPDELNQLQDFYQTNDPESLRLLQAYLQQKRGGHDEGPVSSGGTMTRREALEILGLDENAGPAEIQQAHKKLMQRLHPDRGGSNYLAAKVNEAKAVLLKRR